MRKQLISFAQVIKFCKISSSRGGFNPKPQTPLAHALALLCHLTCSAGLRSFYEIIDESCLIAITMSSL